MSHPNAPATTLLSVLVLISSLALAMPTSAQAPSRHLLRSSDGVSVPAWWFATPADAGTVIALFHQGGASGRAEYDPIVPRLREAGHRVLVIDQRRGGTTFDGVNELASTFDPETTSYCDALPDLEAALDFALDQAGGAGVVLWGSSYSAALAIVLGHRRSDDVVGIVALSPASGEPMDGCRPDDVAESLTVPLLVGRPAGEMEIESVASQLERFHAAGHRTFVADPGRHGSSMLVEERVGADVEAAWTVVLDFLGSLSIGPSAVGSSAIGPLAVESSAVGPLAVGSLPLLR